MGIAIRTSSLAGKVETAQYERIDLLDILSTKVDAFLATIAQKR